MFERYNPEQMSPRNIAPDSFEATEPRVTPITSRIRDDFNSLPLGVRRFWQPSIESRIMSNIKELGLNAVTCAVICGLLLLTRDLDLSDNLGSED